ncbi:MerR family transcriptional regulator [Nesterenkonia ebinurensis]|uniref:MerR family transcriptional regulator n=1 Tax=Nesterenkonia ebinurensis TaxID=2608252 RepID=UPI00123D35F6|nr:MerR family transcriptional regulator [Nesterenkonia ebinurensis]
MVDHDDEPEGLSVAQMAETTGVTGYTLRYYERAGLISTIPRTSGNQRRYRATDVEWVRFLLRLRETGMPIAQMRNYAVLRTKDDDSLRPRLDMLTDHHEALRRQIKTLQAHERALRSKIATYRQMVADTENEETADD